MSAPCHPESKSNALLTPAERASKMRLKSELKFQRRVKKIETRIKHAISRNDPVVEKASREELEILLSTKDNVKNDDQLQQKQQQTPPPSLSCVLNPSNDSRGKAAIDEVLVIWHRLLSSIDPDLKEERHNQKIQQTKKAKHLLINMTKGTQSKSMFQDVTTLRGYARQKFHSRGALIIGSLGKLSPGSVEVASSLFLSHLDGQQQQIYAEQKEIMDLCWEKLGSIERVCSLGCGPGNDAVGVTAFARSYFKHPMKDMFLMDYTINEWKDAILNDLVPILVPEYVKNVTCIGCDVTHSLGNEDIKQCVKESDIFTMSYLLTETRNKWDEFFVELVDLAKVGALFYFSEPVPWQLHRLIGMASSESFPDASQGIIDLSPLHKLRFSWIDSSMYFPDLQKLDGRSGPAVLLAIKV